ncbi:MAG: GTP 3',8-cyclase MoaA [Pyrinomonadaceae bacterium]
MVLCDSFGRTIRDLRISLTDKCNFRCFYCMPEHRTKVLPRDELLTFEEIAHIAEIFVELGIEKIRLTGGEPLVRREIPTLVRSLNKLRPGLKDIALTTNGARFSEYAENLQSAGLDRVTFSLDSLDRKKFLAITGSDSLDAVLESIQIAVALGFSNTKINAVIVRGRNDDEIIAFADFARKNGVSVRFIEFMPLDSTHKWKRESVVTGKEILERIAERYEISPEEMLHAGDTARRYRFTDGSPGEIGIIAPVSQSFCGQCSRIRITADGQIRTCLFSQTEYDLLSILRSDAKDDVIKEFIVNAVNKKEAGHRINEPDFVQPARSMRFIGG